MPKPQSSDFLHCGDTRFDILHSHAIYGIAGMDFQSQHIALTSCSAPEHDTRRVASVSYRAGRHPLAVELAVSVATRSWKSAWYEPALRRRAAARVGIRWVRYIVCACNGCGVPIDARIGVLPWLYRAPVAGVGAIGAVMGAPCW